MGLINKTAREYYEGSDGIQNNGDETYSQTYNNNTILFLGYARIPTYAEDCHLQLVTI